MCVQRRSWFVLALCAVLLTPALAAAQASIAGVVRDPSGAVLPGVTVEASSPVLIEKVRTAVTDGSGLYRIVDLRAGTYSVTFTLPGFSTVKRDGIELTGSLTASVNADLRVGAVEETITVTGETPIVDVQSVRRQATISSDVLTSIPTARGYSGVMLLVPAIQTQGTSPPTCSRRPAWWSSARPAGATATRDACRWTAWAWARRATAAACRATTPTWPTRRKSPSRCRRGWVKPRCRAPRSASCPRRAETRCAAPCTSPTSRSGMVGNNYSDELRAAGLGVPGKLLKLWDYTLGLGGPIKRDRLWYFLNLRNQGAHSSVSGMFANKNAGDAEWSYEADPTRQSRTRRQLQRRQPAPDLPGDAAQQVQRLLGRAEAVQRRHLQLRGRRLPPAARGQQLHLGRHGHRARRKRPPTRTASSACSRSRGIRRSPTASPDGRIRRLPDALGRRRAAGQPDAAAWCA